MIIETGLFIVMIVLSYIFSFGLFAIYPPQGKVMIISLICGIIFELGLTLVLELLIIYLLYLFLISLNRDITYYWLF